MDRRIIAQSFSTAVALLLALHAEAEAELAAVREEVVQLRAALAQRDQQIMASDAEIERLGVVHGADLDGYVRTVKSLREQLREEEARRASYQAVDGAARHLLATADMRRSNPLAITVRIDVDKPAFWALRFLCASAGDGLGPGCREGDPISAGLIDQHSTSEVEQVARRLLTTAKEVSRDGGQPSTESVILNLSARAWDRLRDLCSNA